MTLRNSKFGGLEVFFNYVPDESASVTLETDVKGYPQFKPSPAVLDYISVRISSTQSGGDPRFIQIETLIGGVVIDRSDFSTYNASTSRFDIRIFFFNQFISVQVNDFWCYSYALSEVEYPQDNPTISLLVQGATLTLTNIRRVELSDGREAVYVDYEASTENAIQSIIQQRPVQILPHVDRKVIFTYLATKDTVTPVYINRFQDMVNDSMSLASDALVYFADVGISLDGSTLEEVGFITRLYRLSELDTGAEQAAEVLQRQALEHRHTVTIDMRLDPRIELADILAVSVITGGAAYAIDRQIVVEDIRLSMKNGDYNLSIQARYHNGN